MHATEFIEPLSRWVRDSKILGRNAYRRGQVCFLSTFVVLFCWLQKDSTTFRQVQFDANDAEAWWAAGHNMAQDCQWLNLYQSQVSWIDSPRGFCRSRKEHQANGMKQQQKMTMDNIVIQLYSYIIIIHCKSDILPERFGGINMQNKIPWVFYGCVVSLGGVVFVPSTQICCACWLSLMIS